MRHLWQRIFAFTLALIIVSQAAVFLLYRQSVSREEMRHFISETTRSTASSIEGQSLNVAKAMTGLFNRKKKRAWIENEDRVIIAGASPFGGFFDSRTAVDAWETESLTLWRTSDGVIQFVSSIPVNLNEGRARLFMAFGPPRRPGLWTMFFQGLLVLSVIGMGLALWMARRVSRPLRNLRDEVMQIAGEDLARRVTVSGHDEITDVAVAVNHMADNLAKHIRSMKELVANISHEMRSPLARIQVSLALLEEDIARSGKDNAQAAARLASLREELDHMNALIGATLLSSKLDLQKPPSMAETVAFSELCSETARRYAPTFRQKNLRITRDIEDGVTLPGDEALLKNLVSNLLDNAFKYTAENGEISMILKRYGTDAVFRVVNEHAPLPPEALSHIFEPFYRAGIATGNGVGLGLSLVSKIAALHGGTAEAANTETGVAFTVTLPLKAEEKTMRGWP